MPNPRNFNVKVSEELHRRFKIACVLDHNREMSEVVREAIERYVERIERKQKK